MNQETMLYEAVYAAAVADRESIRARVLKRAHEEERSADASVKTAPPAGAFDAATPARKPRSRSRLWRRITAVPLAACAALFVLVNTSAPFALAAGELPLLGPVIRLITLRTWESENESSSIHGQQPAVEGTGNTAFEAETNALIEEKLSALNAKAQKDAADYRENWIAMGNDAASFVPITYQFDYETYYTGEDVLSFRIRQQETVTTDTVDTYTTLFYYTLHTKTGASLTLADLLGKTWQTTVSDEVDQQIRQSGDPQKISYYEDFWVNQNLPLEDTQPFYLTADGAVAVVFDEGWIAPFEDGPQTFVLTAAPALGG